MDNDKKQILLRLPKPMWADLSQWAEDDLRSINSQIEYILRCAIEKRKKTPQPPSVDQSE